jgi:hypothetical protein
MRQLGQYDSNNVITPCLMPRGAVVNNLPFCLLRHIILLSMFFSRDHELLDICRCMIMDYYNAGINIIMY